MTIVNVGLSHRFAATGAVADGDALGRRLAHLLLEYGGAALLDRTSTAAGQCVV